MLRITRRPHPKHVSAIEAGMGLMQVATFARLGITALLVTGGLANAAPAGGPTLLAVARQMALVVEHVDPQTCQPEIMAIGRLHKIVDDLATGSRTETLPRLDQAW